MKWFITQRRKTLFKLEWVPDLCQLPLWSSEQKNGQKFSYSESWKYSLFFSLTDNSHKKSIFEKKSNHRNREKLFLPKLDWLNFKNGFQVFLLSVKMALQLKILFFTFFAESTKWANPMEWNKRKEWREKKNLEYNKKSRKRVDPSNAGFTSRTGKLVFDSREPLFYAFVVLRPIL